MMSTSVQKRSGSSFLSLGWSCRDSRSVSVSSSFASRSTSTLRPAARGGVRELPSAASTPSFSELLRQLNELEQCVRAWGKCTPPAMDDRREQIKKRRPSWESSSSSRGGTKPVEESVVVVKETADPLGEFRRSMLHMIVEKEIVDGAELRALLRRFLALNSPRHHATILRAFAEIWEEVFSISGSCSCEQTPDDLRRRSSFSRLPPR